MRRKYLPVIALASATMAGSGIAIAPVSTAAAVYTPPTSIDRGCHAGATNQLNSWLSSIPNGTASSPVTVNLGSKSTCFLLNDVAENPTSAYAGVNILSKKNWRITGSATFKYATDVPTHSVRGAVRGINRSAITIYDGENVSLSGITVQGHKVYSTYKPLLEHDHNIAVMGGRGISITGVKASVAAGDNIYVGAAKGVEPRNVLLSRNNLSAASRHNIAVVAGDGVRIDGNNMRDSGYWSIDAELSYPGLPLKNLSVTGNTSRNPRFGFMALTGNAQAPANGVSNILIAGNNQVSPGATNLEYLYVNGVTAKNPIRALTVRNNRFAVNQHGVAMQYVNGAKVFNNVGLNLNNRFLGNGTNTKHRLALVTGGESVSNVAIYSNSWRTQRSKRVLVPWVQWDNVVAKATGISAR